MWAEIVPRWKYGAAMEQLQGPSGDMAAISGETATTGQLAARPSRFRILAICSM